MSTDNLSAKSFYFECSGHHMGNKGDVAMLKCLINLLEKHYPKSCYYIPVAEFAKKDFDNLNVVSIPPLEDYILAGFGSGGRLLAKMIAFFKVSRVLWLAHKFKRGKIKSTDTSKVQRTLLTMKNADAIILSGGGYVNDSWAVPAAIRCGLVPLLGSIFDRPVIFSGHGIGPMKKRWLKIWLKFCLKSVRLFGLREGLRSPLILKELGVLSDKIKVTGDDTLALNKKHNRQEIRQRLGINQNRVTIGLNIRLHGYNVNAKSYIGKVVDVVNGVASRLKACVLFICTDFTPGFENDLCAARDTARMLGGSVDFKYIDRAIGPEEIKSLAGACDIVISQSYHVLVFALSQGVPAVGVYNCEYYADKTKGVFETVQFPNAAMDLRESSSEQIVDRTMQIYQDKTTVSNLLDVLKRWDKLQSDWENEVVSIIRN